MVLITARLAAGGNRHGTAGSRRSDDGAADAKFEIAGTVVGAGNGVELADRWRGGEERVKAVDAEAQEGSAVRVGTGRCDRAMHYLTSTKHVLRFLQNRTADGRGRVEDGCRGQH